MLWIILNPQVLSSGVMCTRSLLKYPTRWLKSIQMELFMQILNWKLEKRLKRIWTFMLLVLRLLMKKQISQMHQKDITAKNHNDLMKPSKMNYINAKSNLSISHMKLITSILTNVVLF